MGMKNKPIISIIIPHYNSPELLRKAILSAAVNDNVEVIVVDDKSNLTETQFATLERFCCQHHANFYRNTTDKKGAGVCRNIGLSHMTGDWLLLLDADDYFMDSWYEVVVKYLYQKYDMVYFPPKSINLNTGKDDGRTLTYQNLVNDYLREPSTEHEIALKYRFCSSCSKLVKSDLFEQNNVRFDETLVSNDVMFFTKCAYYSKAIAVDKMPIYMVTRSGGSLTSKKDISRFMTRVDVLIDRYHYLEERLSPEKFRAIHLNWYATARIADAILSGYGVGVAFKTYEKFKSEGIRVVDKEMFYPWNLIKNVRTELIWHLGIAQSRNKKKAKNCSDGC